MSFFDGLSEADLWMMKTRLPMGTLDAPILTILLHKFCNSDVDKFDELTKLMAMAFDAGAKHAILSDQP